MRALGFQVLTAFLIGLPLYAAEPSPSKEKINSLMKGNWEMNELISWELHRLDSLGPDTSIDFPSDSVLAKRISKDSPITLKALYGFLKSEPLLSDAEKKELLGVLRLANTRSRVDFKDNVSVYRALILDELRKAESSSKLILKLPKEVEDKVIREAKESLGVDLTPGKITIDDFKQVLENPKVILKSNLFNEKELAPLLGSIREASAAERGSEFIADVFEDTTLDKIYEASEKPNEKSLLPPSVLGSSVANGGIKTFFPKDQEADPIPRIIEVKPPANLHRGNPGFESPIMDFDFKDKGRLDRNAEFITPPLNRVPKAFELDFGGPLGNDLFLNRGRFVDGVGELGADKNRLIEKTKNKFSLQMRMEFQGEGGARCQTTVVDRRPQGDSCKFTAATARHCVVNEENPSAKLTHVAIEGFRELRNLEITSARNGHDFAMMTFTSPCDVYPEERVIPLRKTAVADGEALLVETVPGGTMIGRAKDAVSGDSLMALDVRSPENEPFGINPGDSGGGVATLNAEGKLELVGVISSKPVDPSLAGIGFFAAKDAMVWANEFVASPTEGQSSPQTQPGH